MIYWGTKKSAVRLGVYVWLIIVILASPLSAHAESLNNLLKRQREIERQQQQSQQKLDQSEKAELSLQQTLTGLAEDVSSTQKRLDSTRKTLETTSQDISELNREVKVAEQEISRLDNSTRQLYIFLYESFSGSRVTLLASGESIDDFTTRIVYLESIQDQLARDTRKTSGLKQDLLTKKSSQESYQQQLKKNEDQLSSDKAMLVSQKQQQSYLLSLNQEQQDSYEESLKKLTAEHETLSQSIYEARRRQAGEENINQGATSAYPYADEPNPSAADPWLFIKRQCVSYTAWKWLIVNGRPFNNTRPGSGSGWNWPALARDQGYNTSSVPRIGAVVSWPIGPNRPYGHTAWIENVNSDGTIDVSEYNWLVPRGYGERQNVNPLLYGTPTYIYP